MPTQDVRIVRRNGMPVAVLGLSEWGAPIVALTDKTGRILTTWQLTQREWSDLGFFDASGQLRISLELHPEKVPNLMIFEPDERLLTARYVIDPETGKEIPGESGALPWLTPVDLQPTIPISLVDQRGKVMWTAP